MRISISLRCSSQVCSFSIQHHLVTLAQHYLPYLSIRITQQSFELPGVNLEDISHDLCNIQSILHAIVPSSKQLPPELIITMSYYSKSRYQTLCRLGVEQLPSLCADRGYDDMGTSSNGKRDYCESVSPLAGHLPLRTMPVSPWIC
jgi:hypothetical protein